jgi:ankyrin repeat protein
MARAGRPRKSDPGFNNVPYLIERFDNEEVKRILSDIGLNVSDGYSRSALIWATFYRNNGLLTWLINNQADINQQDRDGYSALHFAAQEKNEEAAKLLLAAGAMIDIVDVHGNTPLWTAVFSARGDTRLIKLYVQAGANLNRVNNYQKTPIELAKTIANIDLEVLR